MLNSNASAWFSILMSATLKSTVVLGAAWMLALLLRGRSAAARHLVWTAAAAAVLALPLLSLSLPALRLPLSTATLPANTGLVFRAFGFASADEAAPPMAIPANPGSTVSYAPARPDARLWFLLIWAAGVAVSFLKMLVAYASLWRTRRIARLFDDGGLTSNLAQSLDIPHHVPVLEAAPGGMPMTFGFLRPAVFMPVDSVDWSEDRRRIVLLHELAHVRRGDAATHLIARTALSLNWWNPLAWFAWREFLKERERAADDLVLSAGAHASEYAGHLLEVARSMHTAPVSACAAVAMARKSQLEGRLLAILDSRVNRKPIRGAATPALAALLAALLVAPFAAMRAQEQPAQTLPPEIDATIRAANSQKNHEILEHAAAVYENLKKYDTAQTLLESALAIRGEVSGQQSAAYAAGLVKLGDLAAKRNQPGEAAAFYTKAVSLGDRPEVASALVYLGMRAHGKRDSPQAIDLLQRALNADPSGPQAGPALTWMAAVRGAQMGGSGSAEPSVRFRVETVWNNATSKYEPLTSAEVESLLQRALAAEAPDSVEAAVTMELYARFLRDQKREGEAQPLSNRAAEIRRAKLAADPTMVAPDGPSGAYRVGGGVTAPVVVGKKDPEYTEEARAAKYQGTVLLSVEIGPDGLAHNIRIARSLGLGLDEKAIEAVSQWNFRPGTKDGQPVTVAATIEVNFRLM
jgi:TonB family protein